MELLQWMADFLSEMFDVEATDVSGGKKPKAPVQDSAGASSGATGTTTTRRKGSAKTKTRAQKSGGSVFSLSE